MYRMNAYHGAPMTLGNAAAARVRLLVWCLDCHHQVEPDPTPRCPSGTAPRRPSRTGTRGLWAHSAARGGSIWSSPQLSGGMRAHRLPQPKRAGQVLEPLSPPFGLPSKTARGGAFLKG